MFLHGIEPILIFFLLSKSFPIIIYIVLGFVAHLVEDLIADSKIGLVEHKLSLIYSIYDHRLKKKLKI